MENGGVQVKLEMLRVGEECKSNRSGTYCDGLNFDLSPTHFLRGKCAREARER